MKSEIRDRSPSRRFVITDTVGYWAICGWGLVVHGISALNGGVFADASAIVVARREGRTAAIIAQNHEAGYPFMGWLAVVLGPPDHYVVVNRIAFLVCVLVIGVCAYVLCRNLARLDAPQSLYVAMVAVAFPSLHTSVSQAMVPQVVVYAMFLVAAVAVVRSEPPSGGYRHSLRAAAVVVLVLSFSLKSLPSLYGALLIAVAGRPRFSEAAGDQRIVWYLDPRFVLQRVRELWFVVVLPLAGFLVMSVVYRSHGVYEQYNIPSFGAWLLVGLAMFPWRAIDLTITSGLQLLAASPLIISLLLLAIVVVSDRWPVATPSDSNQEDRVTRGLLLFGAASFILGALPYAAVGKIPSWWDPWSVHFAMLLGIPVGILCLGFVRFIRSVVQCRWGVRFRFDYLAGVLMLTAFTLATLQDYARYQARWARDQSFMSKVSGFTSLKDVSLVWITDDDAQTWPVRYGFYEWSTLLRFVKPTGPHQLAIDTRDGEAFLTEVLLPSSELFKDAYNFFDFDPAGCQADLTIRPGSFRLRRSNLEIALYYWYGQLIDRAALQRLLKEITEVEFRSRPSAAATHCTARDFREIA